MTVLVSFPMARHLGLLGRCGIASREYVILRKGVFGEIQEPAGRKLIVETLCSIEDAELLLSHARSFYHAAVQYIEAAIHGDTEGGSGASAPTQADPLQLSDRCLRKKEFRIV
jgi:hypothetical protein